MATFAVTGLAVLAAALLARRQGLVSWAVLAIGGGYLIGRIGHSAVDGWAAAVGVLLLLAAELAAWSTEHDGRFRTEPPVAIRRAATLGALGLGAAVLDVAALGASGLSGGAGVAVAALGVAAAVGAIALVARLARGL